MGLEIVMASPGRSCGQEAQATAANKAFSSRGILNIKFPCRVLAISQSGFLGRELWEARPHMT